MEKAVNIRMDTGEGARPNIIYMRERLSRWMDATDDPLLKGALTFPPEVKPIYYDYETGLRRTGEEEQ
jgi:hypothetical protein